MAALPSLLHDLARQWNLTVTGGASTPKRTGERAHE